MQASSLRPAPAKTLGTAIGESIVARQRVELPRSHLHTEALRARHSSEVESSTSSGLATRRYQLRACAGYTTQSSIVRLFAFLPGIIICLPQLNSDVETRCFFAKKTVRYMPLMFSSNGGSRSD